jgi:phosphoribosylanthranilate isomerase
MKRVRVKICGITNKEDLKAAVDAGADALGFVVDVPESPRNVTIDRARDLIDAAPPFVQSVVVSVFQTLDRIGMLCSCLAPDAVQLAGPLPRDGSIGEHVRRTHVIRAIAVNEQRLSHAALSAASHFDAVLTDSFVPGAHGGTGVPHNWTTSRAIRERVAPTPLILAGGLTSGNVRVAIETVRPYAVDVSSGVERRPGIKDHTKMQGFIEAVTEASNEL